MDFLLCYTNLTCHFDNFKDLLTGTKYSPEVADVCQYYEQQKLKLPEYCITKVSPPRQRNEF